MNWGRWCESATGLAFGTLGSKIQPPPDFRTGEVSSRQGITMREVQLREAKASLSAMVEEVAHGEAAVITRHGRKTAVLVGYDEWQRLNQVPSFARLLMSCPLEPGDLLERDETPLREAPL
jgi:antitoxin Phd